MSWWYRKFHVCTSDDYGITGLQMYGHEHFNPTTDFGVAHDILEHFPDDSGRMEDELMALGAIVYVRGYEEWNVLQGSYSISPAENLYGEMDTQLGYHGINYRLETPYREVEKQEDSFEEFLESFVRLARRQIFIDHGTLPDWLRHGEQCHHLKNWIRLGFWRATWRYRSQSMTEMVQVFQTTSECARDVMKHAFEGDNVIIRVEPARNKAQWKFIPDPYDFSSIENPWR